MTTTVKPGDVLAVRGGGWAGTMIRLGAALAGQPNLDAHVAIVHHVRDGVTWCIEGRPGGAGWRDARNYLTSHWTVTNAAQPKTGDQRAQVCAALEAALGTPYDWVGIAADAADALHLPLIWQQRWNGQVPGHVVCSSLAAWVYAHSGLTHPMTHPLPETTPADWTAFCLQRAWVTPPRPPRM